MSAVVRFDPTERRCRKSVRTLSRCRVSRSNSRVAHRSCSQRAALVAATPSAASAAMNSSFSCVSNICAAAEDVVTHRWVTDRHETSKAQVKRRWTHLGQPICDSCSKGLSRQAPPPHAHGHSRRHTHPSVGALGVWCAVETDQTLQRRGAASTCDAVSEPFELRTCRTVQ